MINIENVQVNDFKAAFRALRNPKDSWAKSDSIFKIVSYDETIENAETVATTYLANLVDSNIPYTILLDQYTNALIENGSNPYLPHGFNIDSNVFIGYEDMKLAQRMIAGGTDESKFMRQIIVSMDITAPLCW